MCSPAAAVVGAGVALDAIQDQQQADAANDYEGLLYGQRKAQALDDIAQLNAREQQEREAAAADIQRVTRQARMSAGAAKLQALESGVRGRSVDLLLQIFEADRLEAVGAVERNLEFGAQQLAAQRRSAARVTPPRKHRGPFDSPLGIASVLLGGTGAVLGAMPEPKA